MFSFRSLHKLIICKQALSFIVLTSTLFQAPPASAAFQFKIKKLRELTNSCLRALSGKDPAIQQKEIEYALAALTYSVVYEQYREEHDIEDFRGKSLKEIDGKLMAIINWGEEGYMPMGYPLPGHPGYLTYSPHTVDLKGKLKKANLTKELEGAIYYAERGDSTYQKLVRGFLLIEKHKIILADRYGINIEDLESIHWNQAYGSTPFTLQEKAIQVAGL